MTASGAVKQGDSGQCKWIDKQKCTRTSWGVWWYDRSWPTIEVNAEAASAKERQLGNLLRPHRMDVGTNVGELEQCIWQGYSAQFEDNPTCIGAKSRFVVEAASRQCKPIDKQVDYANGMQYYGTQCKTTSSFSENSLICGVNAKKRIEADHAPMAARV
ncbi:unnamed protein product [Phytophthora fragariaefolia]|uniref:Unnamed protein product n=1 Tax=Phytophthora fragariaefolia TaxID=1490495 RepID=A0A9W7D2Q2_9STRA|nr:unnamed protein product [Phytophthora fragariaefolia]